MFLLFIGLVQGSLNFNFPFECNDYICPDYKIGDSICESLCMTPPCNFDSSNSNSPDWFSRFLSSDCFSNCINLGCNISTLGNGTCNPACNNAVCGYSLGDCGYCASGCTEEMLNNSVCDQACNTQSCMYDNNACGWCAEGCFLADLSSSTCMKNCSNGDCNYQDGVCTSTFCAPGCSPTMQENSVCDPECNNANCSYDKEVCLCSDNCTTELLAKSTCQPECNNSDCNYQNHICGDCSSQCFSNQVGNGICNQACNVAACNYDWGDCNCAPGCASTFNQTNSTWTWDLSQSGCNPACLVEDCRFNYGVCNDTSYKWASFNIRASWYQQLINSDPTNILDLTTCNNAPSTCNTSELQTADNSKVCNVTGCSGSACLYCMGLSQSSSTCSRYYTSTTSTCLICSPSNNQIYNFCTPSNCPPGFESQLNLKSYFLNTNLCLRELKKYSPNNYYTIYVSNVNTTSNTTSNNTSNTTYNAYANSLASAFASITRKFTKVILSTGTHDYNNQPVTNPIVTDSTNPLNTIVDLYIQEIYIEGIDPTNRSIIYVYNDKVIINSQALTIYIKNIIFDGRFGLSSKCSNITCMYCPYLNQISNKYFDDHSNPVTDVTNYAQNCPGFTSINFITVGVDSNLYLDTVDVKNFQQQFQSFIYSNGGVYLTSVNFDKIQASSSKAWIYMECLTSSCPNLNFKYKGGNITNLNYGYEYRADILLSGFFKGDGINYFEMNGVTIQYAFVVTGIDLTTVNYFIYIVDQLQYVYIIDCNFEDIFVNGLIVVDVTALSYSGYDLDKYGNVLQSTYTHLNITGSNFTNIGTINSLISYSMYEIVHNVYISKSNFKNIASSGNGVIIISNTGGYNSYSTIGGSKFLKLSNGNSSVGLIASRYVNINNLSFSTIHYSGALISLTQQPNIKITTVSVHNTYDVTCDDFNNFAIKQFINNTYMKNYLVSADISSGTLNEIIYIDISYSAILQTNSFYNTTSTTGYSGLSIKSVSTLQISGANFSTITSNSEHQAMYLLSNVNTTIDNLNFASISLNTPAILYIYGGSMLKLSNFVGDNLVSAFDSPVVLSTNQNLSIINFKCDTCSTTLGDGGALYIIPDTIESIINITAFSCTNCNALSGYGGALYLHSYSSNIHHNITLNTINVYSSTAADGTGIYISEKVSVKIGKIYNISISGSTATEGGIISDNHKKGLLTITYYESKNNTGNFSAIQARFTSREYLLEMKNINITQAVSSQAICYFSGGGGDTLVSITNITIVSTDKYPAIKTISISLTISDFILKAGYGILLSEQSNLKATNLDFTGLYSYGLSATTYSTVNCSHCNFTNLIDGPALLIENNSILQLYNSIFKNINSSQPGIVLSMNVCQGVNIIQDCEFKYCTSTAGTLMSIQSSNLTIINGVFLENESTAITPGISATTSTLYLYSSLFRNQKGTMGAFIYLTTSSTAYVYNTLFASGVVSNSGGAISMIMSAIQFFSCQFINNTADVGGAIYAITLSNITIENCTFTDNFASSGSGIFFSGDDLNIYDSSFSFSLTSTSDSMIILESVSSFIISSSYITGGNSIPGILSYYSEEFSADNTSFTNLIGPLSVHGDTTYKSQGHIIANCNFTENTGNPDGGGIFSSDISLFVSGSQFLNNTAGSGGGISYSCSTVAHCSFNISDCVFEGNIGQVQGGAIYWTDTKPTITNTTFSGNVSPYASNIASFAAYLQNYNQSSRALLTSLDCSPGQLCDTSISIQLLDTSGNVMTIDNSSTAIISSLNADYSVSGTTRVTAVNGVFTFENCIFSGTPGTSVNVSIQTTSINVTQAVTVGDNANYSDSIIYTINLRNCTNGEAIGSTTCTWCSNQYYLIEPGPACKACVTGGNCTGGWHLYPKAGYWKPSMLSETIYACPVAAACNGSADTSDYIGTCQTGYTGNECYGCSVGYTRASSGKCGKCPSSGESAAIIIGYILFIIIDAVILVRSTITSAYSPKALYSIYIKIFTNYIQLLFLTTQFNLQWPSYVSSLFSAQSSIATASDQIFSTDCYFLSNGDTFEDIYYNKLVLTSLLPIIMWVVSFAVWVVICITKNTWKYLSREYLTTVIVLFFLVYPNLVKVNFAVFSCTEIVGLGYWLSENLNIKCWDSNHLQHCITVALPSLIVWAVGVPTIVLILITKRRKSLNSHSNRIVFGFIFNGYKSTRFFWEFMILYRKIIIISISVFMTQVGYSVQALTVVIVLLVSLYLQYELKPYNKNHLNHMETEAVLTATITIYCGMYYLSNELADAVEGVLFVFIVGGNAYFIFYWLYYMCQAAIELLSQVLPSLRKLAGKDDPYPEYVNADKFIKQGVYSDEEEGILSYTMLDKKEDMREEIILPNVKSIKDLYSQTAKSIIAKRIEGSSHRSGEKDRSLKDENSDLSEENLSYRGAEKDDSMAESEKS